MDILEKKEHYILLFDFYNVLLTEKQREYFKAYYFDDLTLAEIAENYNVSRNAIFDQLKKTYISLDEYEEKLNLLEKYQKTNLIYDEFEKLNNSEINELIQKLKEIE